MGFYLRLLLVYWEETARPFLVKAAEGVLVAALTPHWMLAGALVLTTLALTADDFERVGSGLMGVAAILALLGLWRGHCNEETNAMLRDELNKAHKKITALERQLAERH